MNLQALYELRERLKNIVIAGTSLIADDFRLKKAIENFEPLSKAAPVFKQIYELANRITSKEPDLLLDCLVLIDAVICTQAKTEKCEDAKVLTNQADFSEYKNISYKRLYPVLNALETKGSGRYEILHETYKRQPTIFEDYRIKQKLVLALGDSYSEIADMVKDWLSKEDKSIIPLLMENFDPKGGKEMARRIEVIIKVAKTDLNDFYLDMTKEGNADIKVLAIKALSENPSNEEYLKGLLNTEKGKVKEEVYTALAKFDSVDIVEVWSKAFKKNVVKMANLLPFKIKDWMSNIIYRELVNLKEDYFKISSDNTLTKEDKKKKLEEIRNKLIAILANTTNTDNEDIISILGDLVQIEPEYALISLKNICLSTKSEKAIKLAKDLFDKYENEDFLGTAFAAYVISEPKEKVFDRFSRYLSQKPLKSLTDKERKMQKAFFNSLWWVSVKDNKYCYRLTYTNNEKEECAFKDNLDSRFITYIINTEMEIDSRAYGYYIYMSNTKESLLSSLVIDDEKIKKEIGNYTYDRVRKQLLTQGEVNLLKLCDWKEYDDILKGTVDIANQSKKNFSYYELLRIENSLKELPVDDEKLKQIVDNALLNLQEKDTKKSTDKYTLKNTLTKVSEQLGNGVKKEHLN